MAYEYERGIIGMLGGIEDRHFIDLSDYKKELKEVYAKAKVLDEIVKLRNNHYIESKTHSGSAITVLDAKTFGREVSHLINKNGYMEDK